MKDDGEYSSASDFNDDTLALPAVGNAGNDDHPRSILVPVMPITMRA
jgi:hypothetical protein